MITDNDHTCATTAPAVVNYATEPSSLNVDGLVDLTAALRRHAATIDVEHPILARETDDQRLDGLVSWILSALVGDVDAGGPFVLAPRCAPTMDIADDDLLYGPTEAGSGDHAAAFLDTVLKRTQEVKSRDDHIVNKANDLVAAVLDLIGEGYILRTLHEHGTGADFRQHLGPDISTHLLPAWRNSFIDVPPHVVTTLAVLRHRTATITWAGAKNWTADADAILIAVSTSDLDRHVDLAEALTEIRKLGPAVDVGYTLVPDDTYPNVPEGLDP